MKNLRYIKSILIVLLCAIIFTSSNVLADKVLAQPTQSVVQEFMFQDKGVVNPLDVVNCPGQFLNKKISMRAHFDKFSTLGLDYKSAFRSSDDYLSFLIKRDDTKHDIPLSEMKLFLKRDLAEKFIDLKSDDEILIIGDVFSEALGDAWIDVTDLEIIKKAPESDGVE